MRNKLFVSYSKGDTRWRELFVRHMKTMVAGDQTLWLDRESIPDGTDWMTQILTGIRTSQCALLLLTPRYLELGSFANDKELPLLIAEQARGLKLLPVLVENVSWTEHPAVGRLQCVKWRNGTKVVPVGDHQREVVRAISEAGDEARTPSERDSAIERAVIEVCENVKAAFGMVAQITEQQQGDLLQDTKAALQDHGVTLEAEPIHCGAFSMIYRGSAEDKRVAIKVLPAAAWRNRISKALDGARQVADILRDPSFIRIWRVIEHADVHALVMEFVDWPTLDKVLDEYPARRLPPSIVTRILAKIAAAQLDAHKYDVHLGALSPASIHVNKDGDWDLRLTPIRIEGYLARAITLNTGQLMNWDVMSMLTPEVYAGCRPITRDDLDLHEQYYLGLLGLELLIGHKPVEVTCFADLALKAQFFEKPRSFFAPNLEEADRWTEDNPALAYILTRMLSKTPAKRLPPATVRPELDRISQGELPHSLRYSIESDFKKIVWPDFASRFYTRLFQSRQSLEKRFSDLNSQTRMLADAVRHLVGFRRDDSLSPFLDLAGKHCDKGITPDDVEAFRQAFVAEMIEAAELQSEDDSKESRADAWNAILKLGLSFLLNRMPAQS